MSDDPLGLDPETMRRLGYRTVDWLVERMELLAAGPVLRTATPSEMRERVDGPPPAHAEALEPILASLAEDILPFAGHWDHPKHLAYVPGSGTWPAALADFVAAACNVDASTWREAAGPNQVELTVLDWFKEWMGYPADAAGILTSGGSAANMTALACAREARLGAMTDRVLIYVSDQSHSSMARAARILGFHPEQVRVLPSDARFRMRPDALLAAMDVDLAAGWRPLLVSTSAGSTNTGAIDPLSELAAVCHDRGVWLHVDAAYGGFAALSDRGKVRLDGIEQADSITLDPHKWLYLPFECGWLLVRHGPDLRHAFEIIPDYLADAHDEPHVNFTDRGMQLTRTARALKVWVSLRYFGVDAFRAAIDRCLDLAEWAERRIEESSELELLTPATLGIVTFRRRFAGEEDEIGLDRRNMEVVGWLASSGKGFVSSTRLRGRYAIRLCILNHSTTQQDVGEVLDLIESMAVNEALPEAPAEHNREPGVRLPWLARARLDARTLRTLPLFGSLDDAQTEEVLRRTEERAIPNGEDVIEQWEYAREFYVILEGTAEARSGDRVLSQMGPGDFFGELAALDWGAGFAYARTASVIATSPLRVLILSSELLNRLVRTVPSVAEEIRRVQRERVPKT